MRTSRIAITLLSLVLLLDACTIEKRRYREGYYMRKKKKADNTGQQPPDGSTTDAPFPTPPPDQANNPNYNPAPDYNNPFIRPGAPSACIYAGYQDGLVKLSLNAQKFFSVEPYSNYFNGFARAGFGFGDVRSREFTKRFIAGGGVAAGLRVIKIGTEVGYAGYLNGDKGYGYYSAFLRFTPGRQSIYLNAGITRRMGEAYKDDLKFNCGIGIAF